MGSGLRKIQRNITMQPRGGGKSLEMLQHLEHLAHEAGFDEGAKKQREMDIRFLAKVLVELEELPGVGQKTADKLRGLILSKFGYEPLVKK